MKKRNSMTHMPDLINNRNRRDSLSVGSINRDYENNANANGSTLLLTASESFGHEFGRHRKAIHLGNMAEALQTFILLQANSAENEKFEAYIIQFSDHIEPSRNTDISIFFASLPALIQSTIIEKIASSLEKTDTLRAYQTLYDYIQSYSRHAYKYLIRAIKLLVLGAQGMSHNESQKYIKILVTELFPKLCKQRIVLTDKDIQPSVRSTDGKQYISIPYNLFEQYLLLGQQYYIEHRDWTELLEFTNAMLDCCGYTKLSQVDFQSHVNKFQYLQEKRGYIRIDSSSDNRNELVVSIAFMCEFKAVAAEFIQFCHEYYRAICTLDSAYGEEKSCLIPICAIKPALINNTSDRRLFTDTTTAIQPEDYGSSSGSSMEDDDEYDVYRVNSNNKRGRSSSPSSSNSTRRGSHADLNFYQITSQGGNDSNKRQKVDLPDRGGEGLNSYCMGGVDNALQILSKAADCMRHIVELWDWAFLVSPGTQWNEIYGGWEQEFIRVIDTFQLPFDLTNAVLLVRSDMALSSPSVAGNLAKAIKLSQSICDRIEVQRRKCKKENDSAPSEFDIPFMFAFRVLYNISVIYLLVGSIPQSTLEVAIILSVFPIPKDLSDTDFLADEVDCKTVATIFQEHEFGLMRVTQEGLVVRCIKHLIVSLDNDSSHKSGMASVDSAVRWDEKAGQIIVLMQYGWNYWSTRTNFWHKIVNRMKEKKIFRNRVFLEYIYVPEILQTFLHLHNYNQVTLDIIPPEFAMRSGYRYFGQGNQGSLSPRLNLVSHTEIEESPQSIKLPSLSSITNQAILPPPPIYQPSYSNSILPSMSMSPTWYSASTQKNSHVNWMSPSFYYSRPATSVMLPKRDEDGGDSSATSDSTANHEQIQRASAIPSDITVRCLEYRIRKYSPQMTSQRMRQVLQRFLKNMLLKANEGS